MKNDDKHIDELLSCYLDGELSKRRHTEVKRLLSHDPEVVARLAALRKQKLLLGSLPSESAPADLLSDIKASLERRLILDDFAGGSDQALGVMHLMLRRSMTAAIAMVLFGGLAFLVMQILGPGPRTGSRDGDFAVQIDRDGGAASRLMKVEKTPEIAKVKEKLFVAELALATYEVKAMTDIIGKAIYNNGLLGTTYPDRTAGVNTWQITGPVENVIAVLDELRGVWGRFEGHQLTVGAEGEVGSVVVKRVLAEQVLGVFRQSRIDGRIEVARSFSEFNDLGQGLRTAKAADSERQKVLNMPVPKPSLASGELAAIKGGAGDGEKVSFTIVVRGL